MNWNTVFDYRDGKLYWNALPSVKARIQIGDEAGSLVSNTGRFMVCVNQKRMMRSRVIWEMHNGPIPKGKEIDHIDRDHVNDRVENLRLSSRSENNVNRKVKLPENGYRGVEKTGNRWRAKVAKRSVGTFSTPELAAIAYNAEAFKRWGMFATLNEVIL